MRIVRPCLRLFLLSILFNAAPASAQFDSGTVVGTVRDTSGAVVQGAKVTLTSAATGISVSKTSTDDGNYEFPASKPGMYLVTAEKAGFAMALVDNVQLQVGRRRQQLPQPQAGADFVTAHRTARAPRFDNPRVGETRRRIARHIHRAPAPERDVVRHADGYTRAG